MMEMASKLSAQATQSASVGALQFQLIQIPSPNTLGSSLPSNCKGTSLATPAYYPSVLENAGKPCMNYPIRLILRGNTPAFPGL